MNAMPNDEYLAQVAEALVGEIKAEMGRKGFGSSRQLASKVGQSSQYISMRLDGGNPRTGERVQISTTDLIAYADALGIPAGVLIARARAVVEGVALAADESEDPFDDDTGDGSA